MTPIAAPVDIPLAVYLLFAAPLGAIFAGFFIFRPLKPEWTHWPMIASCAAVTAASFALAARVYAPWGIDTPLYTWMEASQWSVTFGVRIDGIGVSVLSMVALVGGLIHVYAAGYMKGDPGFSRFFITFHLFYLSMIGLLVSNNYIQFYLFWEGVGVASYLLIGFWTHKPEARRAALQAFLTNRVGDAGLLLAVLIILSMFGGTRFGMLAPLIAEGNPSLVALSGLLLFWAAAAKSAQFPLYFWLPDAMAGPTPASALMHAATMVTAGIFLLARSWPIISAVNGLPELIACVGAGTAIFAAVLACAQTDLKRILAYSTVSHLGLMTFSLGLGQVGAAIFHLITHGFFKAVLFLCAGNIAHGLKQSTASVSDAGGLARKMPLTFFCFALAALSLAGIWPLAGFYSKDAILDVALHQGGWKAAAGLAIAFGSGLYIFRMLFLTFFTGGGRLEQKGAHPHEADVLMAAPAVFLAFGALGVGWLKGGFSRLILSGPIPAPESLVLEPFSLKALAVGTAAAALAAGVSYYLTMARPNWDWQWRRQSPRLAGVFASDFGWRRVVDAIAALARGGADWIARVWDKGFWDGLIESSAGASRVLAQGGQSLASGVLNDYLWWMAVGTSILLAAALR